MDLPLFLYLMREHYRKMLRNAERGRLDRIACAADSILFLPIKELFALRAQCGRDVRAPSTSLRFNDK